MAAAIVILSRTEYIILAGRPKGNNRPRYCTVRNKNPVHFFHSDFIADHA